MTSQIEDFFVDIKDLIELQLRDEIQNQSEVEKKFKDGKRLIDDLEEDDEEQFGRFRYKYHIEYSIYLQSVNQFDKANRQKDLARSFEKYKENFEEVDTCEVLFPGTTLGNINKEPNFEESSKENSMQDSVEKHLKVIQNMLEQNEVIEGIRQSFEQFDKIPETFEDYQKMVNSEIDLLKLINHFVSEVFVDNDNDQDSGIVESLKSLKILAIDASYSKKISFIQFVLNSPNKKEILYSNVPFTEDQIYKRFRQLSLYFHPDKTNKQTYTPYQFLSKDRNLSDELFKFIQEYKDSLLSKLESASKGEGALTFHEKKANELWKITLDYRNAAKERWDKLKLLKKDEIKFYERDELEYRSVNYGMLACEEYRAACKIADKAKQLKKQVKLRGNIALCLFVSNNFLEAQLYALSAIMLLVQNSHEATQQDLIEAKNIFNKVKDGNGAEESVKLKTDIDLKDNSDGTMALVKVMDRKFSYFEKKAFQSSIDDDLTKLGTELIFKPNRDMIRYQACNEEILRAKKRASTYKAKGVASIGAGTILGGGLAVGGVINIANAVLLISATTMAGPLALMGGLATLGLGIWGGKKLYKKGTDLLEEPEIREKLNNIMIDAVKAYEDGEHQKFLDTLSIEYATDRSLLELRKFDDDINTEHIIEQLLKHGFRSSGIAYLLNLLGEVLNGGKLKIEDMTKKEYKERAKKAFRAVLNEKLSSDAKKLDDRVNESRKKSYTSFFSKVKDFIFLNEYYEIAQEYIDDAQEMPFKSRLEEMRNIARINLAIIDIIDGTPEEVKRAIKIIKDIRDSIDSNYQFVGTFKWRLEILDDFLWVINGEESQEESKSQPVTLLIEENSDNYLSYLNEKLRQASSKQDKLDLYNNIAAYYEQLAERDSKLDKLKSLCHWKAAQKNYEKVCELNPNNLDAAIGFARCLLSLSKYDRVINLYNTYQGLISLSEYWYLRSVAYRKKADYKKADKYVKYALGIDVKNKPAGEQKELLKKLMVKGSHTTSYRVDGYEKDKMTYYDVNYLKNSHSDDSPTYNILSIDGGGIRGILPALWLSEIEHRAHRPISHLFNMIAGTSTGGIIAAGLSAPHFKLTLNINDGTTYNDYSSLEPRTTASELLHLYRNKAEELIPKSTRKQVLDIYFGKTRSGDALNMLGNVKKSLFNKYFDQTQLDKALTELVIPAANPGKRYLFTRYDARTDKSKNETFVNTLMATTASPSYFPNFKIEGKGNFLDGGLYLNNPTMTAYEEAIRYKVANERISILSMGTGSYIPDPSNPGQYWDQLFWNQGFNRAQEIETDSKMYSFLGDRYQRWQVWFDEPIGFVDYNSIPYLLELGIQHIEELDASDANSINKLVESFEKDFK